MITLQENYKQKVVPEMQKQFGYRNRLAVPRLIKVVVNVGIPAALKDQKVIEHLKSTLRSITGQEPAPRSARKSIAAFKIRAGQTVGLIITLRGKRMYDFLERLVSLALPRVRDFRGLPQSVVDRSGNLTLGFRELVAFPEVQSGVSGALGQGLAVTVVTNAKDQKQGLALFKLLGFPLRV